MTSTTETSGIASVVSASKRLAVALTATVLAVVLIASVTIAVAVQGKNEASDRAAKAVAIAEELQLAAQCRNDLLWKVAVATIRNSHVNNDLVIAFATSDTPGLQAAIAQLKVTQGELEKLEREGLSQCIPPPTSPPRD